MKLKSPWTALVALSIVLLYSFLTKNTDLIFRSLFMHGLLIGFIFNSVGKKERLAFILATLMIVPFSFFATFFYYEIPLRFNWLQLIFPGITAGSFLFGLLLKRIPVIKAYKIATLLSFTSIYIIAPSHKSGEGWFSVLSILTYLAAGLYLATFESGKKWLTAFIFLVIPLVLYSLTTDNHLYFLPTQLTAVFIFGLAFFRYNGTIARTLKLSLFGIILALISWPLNENYTYWYDSEKLFTLKEHVLALPELQGNVGQEVAISPQPYVHVYLFWSAYCGSCSREYPYFSDLAEQYKGNKKVCFEAVFLTYRDKDSVYYNEVTREKYAFTWSKALNTEEVSDKFRIDGVPDLLIMNRDGKIYYNGYCHIRPWHFVNTPEQYIEAALKDYAIDSYSGLKTSDAELMQ